MLKLEQLLTFVLMDIFPPDHLKSNKKTLYHGVVMQILSDHVCLRNIAEFL